MKQFKQKIWGAVALCALASVPATAGMSDDVVAFRSETTGAQGLRTEDGRIVLEPVFDEIGKASHDLFVVKLGNRYGYVSREGLNITPMIFREAQAFTATPAGTPYAAVRLDDGWNFIDTQGVPVFPRNYVAAITDPERVGLAAFYLDSRELVRRGKIADESFSRYAKKAVSNYLSFWYPKKEYETTQDWRARVSREKLDLKVEELRRLAAARFVAERGDGAPKPADFTLQKYDADNSTFLLSHAQYGALLVPVPRTEAAAFRAGWPSAKLAAPDYGIGKNDRIVLKSLDCVMPDGKMYRADADAIYEGETTFAGFEVDLPGGTRALAIPPRAVASDVDRDIPACGPASSRARFACILVNETYEFAPNVLFAGEDGYTFAKYCEKTLGIPREHIFRSKNNSLGHMQTALRDLAARAKAFPNAEIIFFYVGNAVADRYGNEYLLPTDRRAADGVTGGLKIKELYETLGNLRAKRVTVFLDAGICHRSQESGGKSVPAKTMVELSDATPGGKSIVFRAAQAEEQAQRFPEKSHGLFTYFLLKKLKETRGEATLCELADFLETHVKQTAVVRFNAEQNVTATPSEALGETWESQKLR